MPTILILLMFLIATPLGAAELAGVTMDDTATIGSEKLVLNGLGLRKKAFIKVYVAGLYLPAKTGDADAILAADKPRLLAIEFLRKVGKGSLTGAWDDCLDNNVDDPSAALKKSFGQLNDWMDDVKTDDHLHFSYRPGTGTTVTLRGEERGTIAGKDFADALFSCWIGREPPSDDFKAGLLGQN